FEISPSRDLSSTFFESPTISLKDFNTLGKAKPESSFKLEAKVSDDHKVKDVYILVNEEKVFYQKIDSAINTKPSLISANLPLQAGSNDIVIVARDNENLSQSYGLQIHRDIE
ncbi:MAG: hypothetical protein KDD52_09465, partial [Bdellovibrionales bacterium]|nr:hypothetical protein [Bdellovibrionales bacterium]